MDRVEYLNDILVRLEELLYHELSGCAAWKVELVGIDFIQSKRIGGNTAEEVVRNCIKEITAAGLVKSMTYSIGGKGILLNLKMKDCILNTIHTHLMQNYAAQVHMLRPSRY